MAKKGIGGTVTFVSHGGHHRHNPPLTDFSGRTLVRRGLSLGAGGVLYFGGGWAMDRWWSDANPYVAEGILGVAGLGLGYGVAKVTKDRWAGVAAAAIPVGLAGYHIIRALMARVPASGGTTTALPGHEGKSTGIIGTDIYDDAGGFMGRVIAEVEDDFGRVIGHVLDDGAHETYVSGGRVISKIPIGIDAPILAGMAKLPVAVDANVLARVPAGAA